MNINVQNLTFSYGKHTIVKDLSFSAGDGECVVLAGPNGSGKSTVLEILAGVLKPTAGSVCTNGKVGYVPQGTALLEDATVEENLKFFAKLAKAEVPVKLPFFVEEYKKRKVAKLSGGMKKQVSIACALMGDPNMILLDEPCAALDIKFRDELISTIEKWKSEGKTVVYVGHDPAEFYDFFDTLVFLDSHPMIFGRGDISIDTEAEFTSFFKNTLNSIKHI